MTQSETTIFPWFTCENHETLRPWLGLKDMCSTLERGGFTIKQIFDLDDQILDPVISCLPPNYIRFEVVLPSGWALVDGYDGYGLEDPELQHLVDKHGRLRGHIELDWKDDCKPRSGTLYCRYALNPPNVHTVKIDRPKNTILWVVVDRAAVNPKRPSEFPIVSHYDIVEARPGPFVPPDAEEFKRALDKDFARLQAGKPQLDPPIFRWLHENYPDWRDPFAYW